MTSSRLSRVLSLSLVLICGAVARPALGADPPEPIFLWSNGAPGEPADAGPGKALPNKPGDTVLRIGDVGRPSLTVYRPTTEKNTGAAVLICPGGGYHILAANLEGTEVAEWLNSIGVTGIVLKYRVPARKGVEKHAAPLQDAQRALGLVRHRAKEWAIDPDKIGVLGFSAGGHLAATLSTNFDKRAYEPIDEADKVKCRPDFTFLIYPAYLFDDKQPNKLAAEIKVKADTPKTFLAMTQDDGVKVECALYYYLALTQAKVPSELHVYPTGGHGYGLRASANEVSHWPQRAEGWLRSIGMLKGERANRIERIRQRLSR